MAQSLAQESKLQRVQLVYKHFVCLGAEREITACRAHLNRPNLIRIGDVGDRLLHITIPKEDRRALASSDQFELVVNPLSHRKMHTV